MVKFEGLICKYDEFNELIVDDNGMIPAVFSFNDVSMTTLVDPNAKFLDWLISADSFAQIWNNAFRRGERHIYEADMAPYGVAFQKLGDLPKPDAKTLVELHKKWSIEDEL